MFGKTRWFQCLFSSVFAENAMPVCLLGVDQFSDRAFYGHVALRCLESGKIPISSGLIMRADPHRHRWSAWSLTFRGRPPWRFHLMRTWMSLRKGSISDSWADRTTRLAGVFRCGPSENCYDGSCSSSGIQRKPRTIWRSTASHSVMQRPFSGTHWLARSWTLGTRSRSSGS